MLLKKKTQASSEKTESSQPKKSMATLRLQKDISQYKSQEIPFVQLSFPNPDSVQTIHVTISPEQNSIYHNCSVTFSLEFPNTYPLDPPKMLCLNKLYHPNITYQGKVCLPLVREDFSPTVTLMSIICGLIFILTYPNADDALNPQIGDLMIKDPEMFKKIVGHTIQGRVFMNVEYDNIRKSKTNASQFVQEKETLQKRFEEIINKTIYFQVKKSLNNFKPYHPNKRKNHP